jgi:hypothetical protein
MAQVNALNTAFDRLGFHPDSRALILEEGYDTFESLGELEDSDIDRMISKLSKTYAPNPNLNPDPNVNRRFPTRAVLNLKAMTYWIREQQRIGGEVTPGNFTERVMQTVKERMRDDARVVKSLEHHDITKPTALKEWTSWPKFKNLFTTYTSQIRGVALCPITYVIRPIAEVDPIARAAIYVSDEERLVRCTLLQGHWFMQDNSRLYNELKSYVIDGPGWAFIQQFDRTGNGRASWMALLTQAEGDATMNLRKQKAYAAINNARFAGDRARYHFSDYISVHQKAHNELDELGEPVSETKKVTDFMAGIQDPKAETAKAVVISSPLMRESFEMTQTYLQHFVDSMEAQKRSTRTVAAVESKQEGKPQQRHKQTQKKQISGPKVHSGNYTHTEWRALSSDEQQQVRELRKNKGDKKRKVASLSTQREEPTQPESPAPALEPALRQSGDGNGRRVAFAATTVPNPTLPPPPRPPADVDLPLPPIPWGTKPGSTAPKAWNTPSAIAPTATATTNPGQVFNSWQRWSANPTPPNA